GGGTTETALISMGDIVAVDAVRVGSFDLDAAIQSYVRREYRIAVGDRTAEEIKLAIGSAWPIQEDLKAEVRGRDLATGLAKTVILTPAELRGATEDVVREIVESVKVCLGNAPPELANDVIGEGLHLVGGGGMLPGLDQRIANDIEVPVQLVESPLECVVLGAGQCLESPAALHAVFQDE
ncbi:MAG TPA: rod shape-determining protein, partial [Acidimicrobiales bacterium]|nr:rod shape-determining protein [Acidimicrobiales bacterium]